MDGDRTARALARIEAAAARIEAALANRPDPDLAARYEELRSEAESVLGEVDALIQALEA